MEPQELERSPSTGSTMTSTQVDENAGQAPRIVPCLCLFTGCLNNFYRKAGDTKDSMIRKIKSGFGYGGILIYERPYTVIIVSVILAMACSVGWLYRTTENDLEKLFVLPDTEAQREHNRMYATVGGLSKVATILVTSELPAETPPVSPDLSEPWETAPNLAVAGWEGLLSREVLQRMAELDQQVRNVVYEEKDMTGETVRRWAHQDVCRKWKTKGSLTTKPRVGTSGREAVSANPMVDNVSGLQSRRLGEGTGDCMTYSILDAYTNPRLFGRPLRMFKWPYVTNISTKRSYPIDLLASGYHVEAKGANGDKLLMTNATGLVMIYELEENERIPPHATTGWEIEFTELLKNFDLRLPNVRLDFVAEDAWEEEIVASSDFKAKDFMCLVIAVVFILVYSIAANFSKDVYKAKPYASVCGCAAACLGMMVGGGLAYLFGLTHVSAMNTAPFLVVGIGLDDMFVILNAYSLTYLQPSPRGRIRQTMEDSGIAITITTLTNLLSFLIGAVCTPYRAVANFCWVVFAGLLGGYIYALTYFVAVLALEADREVERHLWIVADWRDMWEESAEIWLLLFCRCRISSKKSVCKRKRIMRAKKREEAVENCELSVIQPDSELHPEEVSSAEAISECCSTTIGMAGTERPRDDPKCCCMLMESKGRGSKKTFGVYSPCFGNGSNRRLPANALPASVSRSTTPTAPSLIEQPFIAPPDQSFAVVSVLNNDPSSWLGTESFSSSISSSCPSPVSPRLAFWYPPQCLAASQLAAFRGLFDLVESLSVVPAKIAKAVNTFEVAARLVEVERLRATRQYSMQCLYVKSLEEETQNAYRRITGLKQQRRYRRNDEGDYTSKEALENARGQAGGFCTNCEDPSIHAYCTPNDKTASDEEMIPVFEPKGTIGRAFRSFFTIYAGKLFPNIYFKLCIVLIFLTYVAMSIYGISILKVGMEMEALFPADSYIRSTYTTIRKRFPAFGASAAVFFPDASEVDWWDRDIQEAVLKFDQEIENKDYSKAVLNGMRAFLEQDTTENHTKQSFMNTLGEWLTTPIGGIYADDFRWTTGDDGDLELDSWRLRMLTPLFSEASQMADFMQDIRRIAGSSPTGAVPYCRGFRFSETDLVILSQTLFGMLAAFLAVASVSLIILRTSWSAVLVALIIFLVDLGLLGFMPFVGLELNMVTMVTLIMSIGFSVDYTLHVVHTFTDCVGPTRRNRVIETMILMGVAVTNGCFSTFVGILPLCLRMDEYMHQLFFKMVSLILLFGFAHGLLLLPILLSIFGPISDARDHPHPPIHPHLHSQELSTSFFLKASGAYREPPHLYNLTSAVRRNNTDRLEQPKGDHGFSSKAFEVEGACSSKSTDLSSDN